MQSGYWVGWMPGSSLFLYAIIEVDVASMKEEAIVDGITVDGNLYSGGRILLVILGVEFRKLWVVFQS